MDKEQVIDILDELYDQVQDLRESGESDLRTVLHFIDNAASKINKL